MDEFIEAIKCKLAGVEAFSVGACPGCEKCGLEDLRSCDDDPERCELADEPEFSWQPCDSCGSTLGGDRHPAHGLIDNELAHFKICIDCALYYANGELPDA